MFNLSYYLGGLLVLSACSLVYPSENDPAAKVFYALSGDFDGDRQVDKVRLRLKTPQEAILSADLSVSGKQEIATLHRPGEIILSLAQAGIYQQLCQKKEIGCIGSKKTFTLRNDAIQVTYPEKSSRLYVWNGNQFDEIFLTD